MNLLRWIRCLLCFHKWKRRGGGFAFSESTMQVSKRWHTYTCIKCGKDMHNYELPPYT
jgi:hypothetical protein